MWVEAARRPAPGTGNSFLHPVGRVRFASGVEFDRGIEKTGFLNIHEAQNAKTWGRSFGRTGGRGSEPAGAGDGEFLFVCGAPRLVASGVGFDRGIEKKLGFWRKMNINEA